MICYQLFEGVPPFYNYDPIDAARAAAHEHKRPKWGKVNMNNQVGAGLIARPLMLHWMNRVERSTAR